MGTFVWICRGKIGILDLGDKCQRAFIQACNLRLTLWRIMHHITSIWYFVLHLVNIVENYFILNGSLKRYRDVDISKVQHLAVVLDSQEVLQIKEVLVLLRWLSIIGLKKVSLYDKEGVLKNYEEALELALDSKKESTGKSLLEQKSISLEVLSLSDGKLAVTKAANFLFAKHYLNADRQKLDLTELDMTNALQEIGYGVSEPDLMLVYGPIVCHHGFPAWRIRYTEIVHMGRVKSMKFGALVKAIHKFTMLRRNYGL